WSIAARRPRLGCGVLSFGCVVLAAVVGYGAWFEVLHHDLRREAVDDVTRAAVSGWLDSRIDEAQRLTEFKQELAAEMLAGRLSFPQAVERLAASEFARLAPRRSH